jgi:hypothetical protein
MFELDLVFEVALPSHRVEAASRSGRRVQQRRRDRDLNGLA